MSRRRANGTYGTNYWLPAPYDTESAARRILDGTGWQPAPISPVIPRD